MFNVALIGAGRIGRIHGANAAAHPLLRLQAIVDPAEEAAAKLARELGARTATLEEVLDDAGIAGVIIASSTDTHLDYTLRVCEAGKAAFCEKPIDLDLARVHSAASRLEALQGRVFLAFNRRFDPNFRALRSRLSSGAVGTLETLQITSHDPAPPPMSFIPTSGGLFKDMAIHDLDMARWLLGEEPSEVFATASCLVDPEIGRAGDVDTAKIILKTPTGRICVISNSRRSGYGYDQRIEAYGSAGMVRASNAMESTVEQWNEGGIATDRFQNFFLDRYRDAYRHEMDHFVQILQGGAPEVGYRDGIAALELAEAAATSAATDQLVRL